MVDECYDAVLFGEWRKRVNAHYSVISAKLGILTPYISEFTCSKNAGRLSSHLSNSGLNRQSERWGTISVVQTPSPSATTTLIEVGTQFSIKHVAFIECGFRRF